MINQSIYQHISRSAGYHLPLIVFSNDQSVDLPTYQSIYRAGYHLPLIVLSNDQSVDLPTYQSIYRAGYHLPLIVLSNDHSVDLPTYQSIHRAGYHPPKIPKRSTKPSGLVKPSLREEGCKAGSDLVANETVCSWQVKHRAPNQQAAVKTLPR